MGPARRHSRRHQHYNVRTVAAVLGQCQLLHASHGASHHGNRLTLPLQCSCSGDLKLVPTERTIYRYDGRSDDELVWSLGRLSIAYDFHRRLRRGRPPYEATRSRLQKLDI